MDVPFWVWGATIAGILALLIFDFFAHVRTPHAPSLKEAGGWSIFYVVLAIIFFPQIVLFLPDYLMG